MISFLLRRLAVIFSAVLLDFIIGDPYRLPHPVRFMGMLIQLQEKFFRRIFHTDKSLKFAGLLLLVFSCAISASVTFIILKLCSVNAVLLFIAEVIICASCVAARSLAYEAEKTLKALSQSLAAGRAQLSNIVGRDTADLSAEEVLKACIETVAENISDGVIAPLFYMILFGALGGIVYKQINTLDSMVGYKNERYEYFGFFSAKCDDAVNFLPSRISAYMLLGAALLSHKSFSSVDIKRGKKIFKRDRFNHLSPNSAQSESMVAGLLGVQLGGTHRYFGKPVVKKTIGDAEKTVTVNDAQKTIDLIFKSEILFTVSASLLLAAPVFLAHLPIN